MYTNVIVCECVGRDIGCTLLIQMDGWTHTELHEVSCNVGVMTCMVAVERVCHKYASSLALIHLVVVDVTL